MPYHLQLWALNVHRDEGCAFRMRELRALTRHFEPGRSGGHKTRQPRLPSCHEICEHLRRSSHSHSLLLTVRHSSSHSCERDAFLSRISRKVAPPPFSLLPSLPLCSGSKEAESGSTLARARQRLGRRSDGEAKEADGGWANGRTERGRTDGGAIMVVDWHMSGGD